MHIRSWFKRQFNKALVKRKTPNPQPNPINGHRGSEIATDSALPSIVIVSESSEAIEAHRGTTEVGSTRNDALNHDAISTTASVLRNDTHNTVRTEYEAPDICTNAPGGFFSNAHHMTLNNSSMVDNSTKFVMQGADDNRKAKDLLLKHMIPGAAHDSSARDPPPQCHPGTRIKINARILAWFYDEIKQELVLWISGPAGVGKSAIVQTFAAKLASAGCLGASVFFSRPNGRDNSHAVFITIAYQLAVHIESYCAFISELLAFDPEIVNKSMEEQFKAFIVKPFVEKKIKADGKTWGILLDGLDELDERSRQQEIIRLITTLVRDHPKVPLVWVIASRSEPHITNTFKQQRLLVCNFKEEYVPIDSPEACQDVERYLRNSLEQIQKADFPHIVDMGWPDETKMTKLADAASGLFAFADVAVRFIRDPNYADPITRLDDVISVVDGLAVDFDAMNPFALLDALYIRILTRIPVKTWPTTQRVLGATTASRLMDSVNCVKGLSVVLGLPLSKVYAAMNDLYSLCDIPSLADVYSRQLRYHHASFVDFLQKPARSKEFYTPKEDAERDLTESCVRIWLDFKKKFAPGPSDGYRDQWSKYASQFHSEGNQPLDHLRLFNNSLFGYIHDSLWSSLKERWSTVQQEGPQHHWDDLLVLLSRIDAGTAYVSFDSSNKAFVNHWYHIWKTHREELTSRGVAREIRLKQLRSDFLERHKGHRKDCVGLSARFPFPEHWIPETFDEYISCFMYFQQHHPELQVLICGPLGSRFAIFVSEITKGGFQGLPPSTKLHDIVANNTITVYHCVPCSDDV